MRAAVVGGKAAGAWAGWDVLAHELGQQVASLHASSHPGVGPDVVTWVPGRPAVLRRRGIDHARVLARAVAEALGVPLQPLLLAGSSAGRRVEPRRRRTAGGPPFVADPRQVSLPPAVLLVDDVLTTGVTARSAAAALGDGGAEVVDLVVLARSGADPVLDGS